MRSASFQVRVVSKRERRPSLASLPATAESVAVYGVNKFLKGKTIIIHGALNKFLAFGNRFTARAITRKIAGYLNRR